jgi:biopolymer transport protein ExbB/TolQ
VLGIVRSFKEMSKDIASASSGVMAGIAEALVATAVGLLVAIPAVVAYNVFKGMVKDAVTNTEGLTRVLMAELKSASNATTAAGSASASTKD